MDQAEREQIMALARLVPTVLASGRAWAAEVSAAELGLAALLPKPFDLQALLDVVRTRQRSHDHAWSPPSKAESLRR